MNKTRTLLVDASYLMKKSFNGAKDVYTKRSDGLYEHIGGLYQFLTTLRMLIKELNIQKVVLCWDGENSGLMRYKLNKNYKANRKNKSWFSKIQLSEAEYKREVESEKSFLKQKIRVQQYCEELFIRQIEANEIEGDDIIAYYTKEYHNDELITIYSNDRDYCQLLNYESVSLYLANIKKSINKNTFFMFFKYHYSNAVLMKMICGDTSDNIFGIDGIQEKTLLKNFPDLKDKPLDIDDILEQAKEILLKRKSEKKEPLKALENLLENKQKIRLNKKLVDLSEPMVNRDAIDQILNYGRLPLDPDNRGSKNLMKYMSEDKFLTTYGSDFISYVTSFYPVITYEKKFYENS